MSIAVVMLSVATAFAAGLNAGDTSYLTSAMQVQLGRYALATVAAQHGTGAVKSFAHSVAVQSSADSRTLDALAKRYGVPPAKGPLLRDSYHYGQLRNLKGDALNGRFVMDLRIDDELRMSAEKHQMESGSNAALRAFAKRRYASLQHELNALSHLH
jgi:Domain of unknown function (DUF4142)